MICNSVWCCCVRCAPLTPFRRSFVLLRVRARVQVVLLQDDCSKGKPRKRRRANKDYNAKRPYPLAAVAVACGALHTVVLTKRGEVYTFGCGRSGQLGTERPVDVINTPVENDIVPTSIVAEGAVAIAAGDDHTVVVLRDGTVLSFGCNRHKQLGHDAPYKSLLPLKADVPTEASASAHI